MIDFRCKECSQNIRATIEVQNLSAMLTYKLFKTKVTGNVRQLFGDATTIQIKDVYCPTCKEQLENSQIKGMCQLTKQYIPLEDLRIVGVKIMTRSSNKPRTKKYIVDKDYDMEKWITAHKGKLAYRNPVKLEWKEL